jgi:hypothetical protein
MHVPINVKSPNNISEWQIGFNSTFKGLIDVMHMPGVGLSWCELALEGSEGEGRLWKYAIRSP